ncbi:hypothetical protein MRB53_021768 [Persea americana]|uniref:Uncharacterized protein n=1 Tax=Persea americana TaxID=3435 RepID=A0ACC2L5J6_PERAE|nr:hypothetical protein MRB53_021768 [Persea americana]
MKMRGPNNDSKESPEQQKETLGDTNRISSLPESILLHILSFMDTNDAVRTGILSKSWRHLWTSVPNLNFVQSYRRNKDRCAYEANFNFVESYVNFVDDTLPCHVASNIHKFSISFSYS